MLAASITSQTRRHAVVRDQGQIFMRSPRSGADRAARRP